MRCHVLAGAIVLLALLTGCSQSSLMKTFGSSVDEKVATHYMDLLRDRHYAQIEKGIDPSLRTANLHAELVSVAAVVPTQPPLSMKLVGAKTFKSPGVDRTNFTFEYQYPDRWLLISVATQTKGGVFTLIGLRAHKLKDSLEQMNRFTLVGKSSLQYVVLACRRADPVVLRLCAGALRGYARTQAQVVVDHLHPARYVLVLGQLDHWPVGVQGDFVAAAWRGLQQVTVWGVVDIGLRTAGCHLVYGAAQELFDDATRQRAAAEVACLRGALTGACENKTGTEQVESPLPRWCVAQPHISPGLTAHRLHRWRKGVGLRWAGVCRFCASAFARMTRPPTALCRSGIRFRPSEVIE